MWMGGWFCVLNFCMMDATFTTSLLLMISFDYDLCCTMRNARRHVWVQSWNSQQQNEGKQKSFKCTNLRYNKTIKKASSESSKTLHITVGNVIGYPSDVWLTFMHFLSFRLNQKAWCSSKINFKLDDWSCDCFCLRTTTSRPDMSRGRSECSGEKPKIWRQRIRVIKFANTAP